MRTSAPVDSPYALPEIELSDGNLLGIIEQAEEAILAASDQRLFQRGGKVVHLLRIECKETTRGITREAGSLIIEPAMPECICLEMARTARYLKWNKGAKAYLPADPPKKYAQFMAAQDELPFRVLLGTIETPTLRPDGSILQKHGYDEDSALYFDSPIDFPPIPENPSMEDAAEAWARINDLLDDFPFVDDSAKAVAIAAILTALVRRSLPAAPMFIFDAPSPRSGKTLLTRVTARIATGRDPAMQTYTGDDEEDRKRIVASLVAGDAVVSYDNVTKALHTNATLCQALTQTQIDDRWLGTMFMVRVPSCTTFLATGNNIVVSGKDLCTRVLKCRIDAGMEKPEEREFDYDLLDIIGERRAELVVAALTIMRAYIVASRPRQVGLKQWGGYEEWCKMVRNPLVWLGCTDPCKSRIDVEEEDPESERLFNLLAALEGQFPDRTFTTAETVELAQQDAQRRKQYGADMSPLCEGHLAIHPASGG
jgi:hypothetical protein